MVLNYDVFVVKQPLPKSSRWAVTIVSWGDEEKLQSTTLLQGDWIDWCGSKIPNDEQIHISIRKHADFARKIETSAKTEDVFEIIGM